MASLLNPESIPPLESLPTLTQFIIKQLKTHWQTGKAKLFIVNDDDGDIMFTSIMKEHASDFLSFMKDSYPEETAETMELLKGRDAVFWCSCYCNCLETDKIQILSF